MKRYLLIGSGSEHGKRIFIPGHCKDFSDGELIKLDIDPDLSPDIVWDLDCLPYTFAADNEYDEIHAYEVLEHCGTQGDGKYFFAQFAEFWRMLKPDGQMMISVPRWDDEMAWGVPDHKRVMTKSLFGFLNPAYYSNLGKPGYADYRKWLGETHFEAMAKEEGSSLFVVLTAVKS